MVVHKNSNVHTHLNSVMSPNLLINSNFARGIINQRGKTNYVVTSTIEMTADRWISFGINVSVASYFLKLANRTTVQHSIRQNGMNIKAKRVTIYLNVDNIIGNSYVSLNGHNPTATKIVQGEQTVTLDVDSGVINSFCIYVEPSAELSLLQCKIEEGDVFTGMPPFDREIELLRCQRYFEVISIPALGVSGTYPQFRVVNETPYFITMSGFIEKVSVPAVRVIRINSNDVNPITATAYATQIETKKVNTFVVSKPITRPYLLFTCEIDANSYF